VDPVALAARGESVWHRLGLAALGVGWAERDELARRTRPSSPVFLGALFERTSVEAFTGSTSSWAPGTIHPPAARASAPA
jgi:hypothetical protein